MKPIDNCRIDKNIGSKNFGESTDLNHWQKANSATDSIHFHNYLYSKLQLLVIRHVLLNILMLYTFTVGSMVWGYHEYKSIWENPSADNELICEHEVGNPHDTYAVAIKKSIVGVLYSGTYH